jgi:hypothetical protein
MPAYREIATNAPDYEPLPFYSSEFDAEQMAQYLRESIGSGGEEELAATAGVLTAVPDADGDGAPEEPVALEGTGTEE